MAVTLLVRNDTAASLELLWFPGGQDDKEVHYQSIAPASMVSQATSPGAIWRARSSLTLEIVQEKTASDEAEQHWDVAEAGEDVVDVELTVANRSCDALELFWCSEAEEIWYSRVEPGSTHIQQTHPNASWRVRQLEALDQIYADYVTTAASANQQWIIGSGGQGLLEVGSDLQVAAEAKGVVLRVLNSGRAPLELLWVSAAHRDSDGAVIGERETWYCTVQPGFPCDQATSQGEVWRVRSVDTLQLVAETCAAAAAEQSWSVGAGAGSSAS